MKNILLIVLVCLCIWIVYAFYAKPTGTETITSSDPDPDPDPDPNNGGNDTPPNGGNTNTPSTRQAYKMVDYAKQIADRYESITGAQKVWLTLPTTTRSSATQFLIQKFEMVRPLYIEHNGRKYSPEDVFGIAYNLSTSFRMDSRKSTKENIILFITHYMNMSDAELVYKP